MIDGFIAYESLFPKIVNKLEQLLRVLQPDEHPSSQDFQEVKEWLKKYLRR